MMPANLKPHLPSKTTPRRADGGRHHFVGHSLTGAARGLPGVSGAEAGMDEETAPALGLCYQQVERKFFSL